MKRAVRREAVKMLARERIKPNFGNAGAVNNLIGKAALRLTQSKGAFARGDKYEQFFVGVRPDTERPARRVVPGYGA